MKNATSQPKKRIYSASAASYVLEINGPDGKKVGTLTIEPNALNAITWRGFRKQEVSDKKKTLLNLVEWMES
jgi:hypothetical protein